MKPTQIQVGKKYGNKFFDGVVYLGIGDRSSKDAFKFSNKKLVVIQTNDEEDGYGEIGAIVPNPESGKCHPVFWKNFYCLTK